MLASARFGVLVAATTITTIYPCVYLGYPAELSVCTPGPPYHHNTGADGPNPRYASSSLLPSSVFPIHDIVIFPSWPSLGPQRIWAHTCYATHHSGMLTACTDPLALTKAKKRPRSQGSTASIHSAATQPNLDHAFTDVPEVYQSQWIPNDHSRTRELGHPTTQMIQDNMVLASQLHTSREFAMDSQVNTSMQNVQYHDSHSMSRQSLSADSFGGNTSFVEDSQMVDHDGNNDHGSYIGMASQSKGGSRSSANNEVEMRQLYVANRHRNLQEVAEELHGNERGPHSERTRQVFAMLWYVGHMYKFCRDCGLTRRQDQPSLLKGQGIGTQREGLCQLRLQVCHREDNSLEPCQFWKACPGSFSRTENSSPWCSRRVKISLCQLSASRRPA